MALLKVVSHQNCLPITNHFYQSLIKKRIVMLNKNQSNKKSIWKYTLILPVIIAFVFLFQIKVVAQEKEVNRSIIDLIWTKNSSDQELKEDAKNSNKIIKFDFTKIERNEKNEITSITISFKDNIGNEDTSTFENKNGINPIHFVRNIDENGKGEIGFYNLGTNEIISKENEKYESIYNSHYESDTDDNLDRLYVINGKSYTKENLKGKNIAIIDGNIIKVSPKEAKQKYGKRAKDGAIIFQGESKIIDNVLDSDYPAPPSPSNQFLRLESDSKTIENTKDKNMLLIINGKEYFQNDVRDYTFKFDGSITHYADDEAIKRYGEKAKDGVMIFNGATKLEIISSNETNPERKEAELNAKQNSNLSEKEIQARQIVRNKLIEKRKKVLEERKSEIKKEFDKRKETLEKRKKVVEEKRKKHEEDGK
jgi:hypothetical protein